MAAKKQARKPDLEGILEDAKSASGVNLPDNVGNEALLRTVALYYLTSYDEKARTKEDLWAFMSKPIPELYTALFDVWVQKSKNPTKKGFQPLFKRQMSPKGIYSAVEKYFAGRKSQHAVSILSNYLRHALIDLYRN